MSSEDQDEASKTEDPSAKKLEESRKKGQVSQSREVGNFAMLLAGALVVAFSGPFIARDVGGMMRRFVEEGHAIPVEGTAFQPLVVETMTDLLLFLLVPFVLLTTAAVLSSVLQFGLLWSTESMEPKLSKISPISGAKRLFSMRNLVEFLKGILKIIIVGTVAFIIIAPELRAIDAMMTMTAWELISYLFRITVILMFVVVAIVAVIAVVDFLYQRFEHLKQLRMTKQEVKDEYKQSEGDPMIKARLRQIRQERARRRMMAQVPGATVVVTNPTHYAIALLYDQEVMAAPKVVAKGADLVALRIRQIAEENDVPIVENPPLARALHAGVDLDQEIPEEHYKAVAEVISYVMRLKRRPVYAAS